MQSNAEVVIEEATRPARTWTDFSHVRWTKREVVKSRLGKVGFAEFLSRSGLPHARILKRFLSAEAIDLTSLPDSFVLKPASLWSSKGVMLLHRIAGTPLLYDAMKRAALTEEEICARQRGLQERIGKTLSFIVEERVFDEDEAFVIPLDYKIFTFYGVTKFVLQVDRNHTPPRICFYDGEFEPLLDERVSIPDKRKRAMTEGVHRKPACFRELLEMARTITHEMEAPFISVDCYATKKGPLFGELTHTPGGPWYGLMYRFSDAFDAELGEAWADACRALGLAIPQVDTTYEIRFQGRVVRTVEDNGQTTASAASIS